MAEEIDFENGHIWHRCAKWLSSGSRDSHVSRDTRERLCDRDSAIVALSIDTSGLTLCLLVAEKSSFGLRQNRLKTALPAKFKVEYFENETEIQKSGLTDFRYCPIDS